MENSGNNQRPENSPIHQHYLWVRPITWFISFSHPSEERATILIPVLRMRKRRHRDVRLSKITQLVRDKARTRSG